MHAKTVSKWWAEAGDDDPLKAEIMERIERSKMQEAKYSFNLKLNLKGYDAQLTLRDDESLSKLLAQIPQLLKQVEKLGATPERRWENGKNGKPAAAAPPPGSPPPGGKAQAQPKVTECPVHHKAVESKFGGLYCPSKNKDGSFCDWKAEEE